MSRTKYALILSAFAALNGHAALGENLQTVTRGLAPLDASFPAVHARVSVITTSTPAYYRLLHVPSSRPSRTTGDADWSVKGGKFHISWTNAGGAGHKAAPIHHTEIFDGRREFQIDESVRISGGEAELVWDRPLDLRNPMEFGYTHRGQWYHEILRGGSFRVTAAPAGTRRSDVTILTGDLPSGAHLKAFLDRDRGWMVVRLEEVLADGDLCVFEAADIKKVRGVWLPLKGIFTWSMPDGGREVALTREQWVLRDIRVGPVPDSLFVSPRLIPGAVVTSEGDGRIYRVGMHGVLIPAGRVGSHGSFPRGELPGDELIREFGNRGPALAWRGLLRMLP